MFFNLVSWLLTSLILTEAFEVGLARLALGVRSRYDLVTVALAQVVTNPTVQFVAYFAGWTPRAPELGWQWVFVLLAEIVAFVVEGVLYRASGMKRPWLTSAVLNGASFLVGLLLVFAELL